MKKRAGLLSLTLLLVLLAGCGFHLRGTADLPPALQTVRIKGDDIQMKQQLERVLSFSGATVVEGSADAATLELLRSEFKREVRTLDDIGSATSYSLNYEVIYRLLDSDGEVLKRPTKIRQVRSLNFNSNQLLQARDQERFLEKDMRREIVLQLMRQLEALAPAASNPGAVVPAG